MAVVLMFVGTIFTISLPIRDWGIKTLNAVEPGLPKWSIPDFSAMEKAGLIAPMSQRMWNDRQYLWPIPTKEVLINENLEQNPGY